MEMRDGVKCFSQLDRKDALSKSESARRTSAFLVYPEPAMDNCYLTTNQKFEVGLGPEDRVLSNQLANKPIPPHASQLLSCLGSALDINKNATTLAVDFRNRRHFLLVLTFLYSLRYFSLF